MAAARGLCSRCLKEVALYTDGSCWGNPGPGGWAAILVQGSRARVFGERDADDEPPDGAPCGNRRTTQAEPALPCLGRLRLAVRRQGLQRQLDRRLAAPRLAESRP